MSPLLVVVVIAAVAGVVEWALSLATRDYSWVDRSWSIVPVIYVGVVAGFAHFDNVRLDAMAALALVWGTRLTFNFARKGGYSGVEDYRWAVLRARMTAWQIQLFNVFFIVFYQNLLLVLITLPALTAFDHRATPFGPIDVALVVAFLLSTLGETIADQQQWEFQSWKRGEVDAGRSPSIRFVQTGLFEFSRHPNFFFEQAQWWIMFLLGATAARSLVQWSLVGPVLLTMLFIGSTSFTEKISLSKYPEYAQYQATTSSIVPWFRRRADREIAVADSE